MIILKHNKLSSDKLIQIERQYLRWMDIHSSNYTTPTTDIHVLDSKITDLYGYLIGMFAKLDVLETLNISVSQLLDFLIDVQSTYQDTPYHSFYHATDVVVVLYYILVDLNAKKYLTNLEIAVLAVAAICHDAGHTGYNNDYHVKMNTELSIRYQQTSVLESLSVDLSLDLLKKHCIFHSQPQCLVSLRKLILATDMTFHYDLLTEARALEDVLSSVNLWDDEEEESDIDLFETLSMNAQQQQRRPLSFAASATSNKMAADDDQESIIVVSPLDADQRLSFACILLHAADISNTVRSWPISKQWSDLIVQEFFRQGDAEKAAGFPVSPGMDRDLTTQPSISLKFGDFVVKPYFEALAGLLPSASIFLESLEENREEWCKLKESPLATSITNYFNGYLASRFSMTAVTNTTKQPILTRKVSVPAGTVTLPPDQTCSNVKPMPILRTTSLHNILNSSVSSELRRNSEDHRDR